LITESYPRSETKLAYRQACFPHSSVLHGLTLEIQKSFMVIAFARRGACFFL
jgi:hypothetical protein